MKEAILPPPIEGLEGLYEEVSENPLFFATIAWKFTHIQRRELRRRDGNRCNFPETEGHGGYLHVHHIVPKSLGETTGIPVDHPLNAITVCEEHHKLIHGGNGAGEAHNTKNGAVIWDHTYDSALVAQALENTQKAIRRGWTFPNE